MGRPRKQKPIRLAGTLTAPDPKSAKAKILDHVEKLNPGAIARRIAEAELQAAEDRSRHRTPQASPYRLSGTPADPLRAIVYDQLAPDTVLAQVQDGNHAVLREMKWADTPLAYLFRRVEKSKRITAEQFKAGQEYHMLNLRMASMGSNTNAIVTHLQIGPKVCKQDWQEIADAESRGTDYALMREAVECHVPKDPSDKLLAAAWASRRIVEKLEGWERAVLDDLILRERPLGMIAQRWGVNAESISLVVRLALWKLARVLEEMDAEYAAWLSIQRQIDGAAKL